MYHVKNRCVYQTNYVFPETLMSIFCLLFCAELQIRMCFTWNGKHCLLKGAFQNFPRNMNLRTTVKTIRTMIPAAILKRIMTGLFSQVLFADLRKRRRFIRFGETYALGDVKGIEALAQLNEVDFVLVQSLFAALEVLHHSSSSSRKRDSPSSNPLALSYGVCAFL